MSIYQSADNALLGYRYSWASTYYEIWKTKGVGQARFQRDKSAGHHIFNFRNSNFLSDPIFRSKWLKTASDLTIFGIHQDFKKILRRNTRSRCGRTVCSQISAVSAFPPKTYLSSLTSTNTHVSAFRQFCFRSYKRC